ncbi:MAG: hypothetical protein MJE68_26320, partial [Proteobacteria bacterium]|nr:hypothetical protein [Pseudomonadota bacterium]
AKFKSANILLIAIWGSTPKFNAHQTFWLYGISPTLHLLLAIYGDCEKRSLGYLPSPRSSSFSERFVEYS